MIRRWKVYPTTKGTFRARSFLYPESARDAAHNLARTHNVEVQVWYVSARDVGMQYAVRPMEGIVDEV